MQVSLQAPVNPQIPSLAQSENKTKFLDRLCISSDSDHGRRIYQLMKQEAVAGRARVSETTESLLPGLASNPNVRPPYSNTQITDRAMHIETLRIYELASPETRPYYEKGRYQEGSQEGNWVIKWLLWHVFRYRDSRNRGRSMTSTGTVRQDSRGPSESSPNSVKSLLEDRHRSTSSPTASIRSARYYDPVRDAADYNGTSNRDRV